MMSSTTSSSKNPGASFPSRDEVELTEGGRLVTGSPRILARQAVGSLVLENSLGALREKKDEREAWWTQLSRERVGLDRVRLSRKPMNRLTSFVAEAYEPT